MRLFLDSNMMTYIAVFEGYLCEGTRVQFDSAVEFWRHTDKIQSPPDLQVLREVGALRILYLVDDQAHFDWLFSEMSMDEILGIENVARRGSHYHLLDRFIEHRDDTYAEEGRSITLGTRAELCAQYFPNVPKGMKNDALQYCELVEADYFLTNDHKFIRRAGESAGRVEASRVSELPFIAGAFGQQFIPLG